MTSLLSPGPEPPPLPLASARVAVVDRSPLDRELLAVALGATDGVVVTGAVATLPDLPAGPVDAVLVRAGAPGTDLPAEVGAAAGLRARVVVVATYVDDYLVAQLRAAGADAVVSSDVALSELLDLLRGATAGVVARPADRRELGRRHQLTRREQEILDHLADGLAPGQIAHLLDLRVSTIRDHVKSLRAKLDCSSATQLVITAHRLGLVPQVGRPLR